MSNNNNNHHTGNDTVSLAEFDVDALLNDLNRQDSNEEESNPPIIKNSDSSLSTPSKVEMTNKKKVNKLPTYVQQTTSNESNKKDKLPLEANVSGYSMSADIDMAIELALEEDMTISKVADPEKTEIIQQIQDCATQKNTNLHFGSLKSAYKKVRKMKKLTVLVFISRMVPGAMVIGGVIYILILLATPSVWSTDTNVTDQEILSRTADRGLFVSMVGAILMNLIGALMFYIRVRESLVVTNYGFILGPVIGFLLDLGIGTEEGWKYFGQIRGFEYTFSTLISGNFGRFIITIFLDLFISNPLQDIMKTQIKKIGVIDRLKSTENKYSLLQKYDAFVAMNYPSILQSIIAFVTFNAYTNQTRFAWAYPGTLAREYRIPPGAIMMSTAIASILYLTFYTLMDYISVRQYFDINTKLGYVLVILGILYGLNGTDTIEAPVECPSEDENGTLTTTYAPVETEECIPDVPLTSGLDEYKPLLGIIIFIGFVLYGLVYPLWTRCGCCGKCRPEDIGLDEKEDEFGTSEDEELKTKSFISSENDEILKKIKQQIANEIRQEMSKGK